MSSPTDEQLLAAVRDLFDHVDPPPPDLADGALARLAAEELDVELLTLVDSAGLAGAVRGPTDAGTEETVTLEFAGAAYRVLLRIDTVDGRRRVDGWVVPAVPLRVSLVPDDDGPVAGRAGATGATGATEATPDDHGRFEFPDVQRGRHRVWLFPEAAGGDEDGDHPFATPPFLI